MDKLMEIGSFKGYALFFLAGLVGIIWLLTEKSRYKKVIIPFVLLVSIAYIVGFFILAGQLMGTSGGDNMPKFRLLLTITEAASVLLGLTLVFLGVERLNFAEKMQHWSFPQKVLMIALAVLGMLLFMAVFVIVFVLLFYGFAP